MKKGPKREKILEEYKRIRGRQYRLDSIFRDMVAKHAGVTITEMICMSFLLEKKRGTPGELAKVTGLTTGAITGAIARLEEKGCVKYTRDTEDKRKVVLYPVAKEITRYTRYYDSITKKYFALLKTFDEKQLEFLISKSKKITHMLEEEIAQLNKEGNK